MTREEVFALIQAHLADELELDPARIDEGTRFKEDLEADSLDLYTLVQELEDSYGVKMSDEQAAKILTVGQAVDFVLDARAAARHPSPADARRTARRAAGGLCTGRSSRTRRGPSGASDSYSRLAFLGDSVLGLAVTTHLYPRLEAERFGAGRLTKIRAQSVSRRRRAARSPSGSACPSGCAPRRPTGVGQSATSLVETERVLASVIEAVIGACYLHDGYERTAAAVVEAFQPEIEERADATRSTSSRRCRSAWRAAREVVDYDGRRRARAAARPHVRGRRDGRRRGRSARGRGRSKKHAEQEAARVALEALHPTPTSRRGAA